jgi:archaellum component FlaG (FlaF/FlaG flagellin family)
MPATSATHLIFFIAAIFIAVALVGSFTYVINDLNDAMESRGVAESKSIRSRIEIINDLTTMPYDDTTDELDIYVKNTGAQVLYPNQTLMLIDGMDHNYTVGYVGGASEWSPGVTVVFTVEDCVFSSNSDHFVKATASYGASDRKEFRIGDLT